METLTQDLYIYEIVLLCLGVLLFLILSIGLVYYIFNKGEIKKLLLFFPIAIVMIAYPSIKQISISQDKIDIIKYQQDYTENPDDPNARQKLEELVARLENRVNEPQDILQISKAYLILGDTEKAIWHANRVLDTNKSLTTTPDTEKKATLPISDLKVSENKTRSSASQIRQLATLQEKAITTSDTSIWKAEIKTIPLNKDLRETSRAVRRNITLKTGQSND